jgi:hypothetical protein
MSIIVRNIDGKSININVRRIDSIQSLKEKIYSRTGISINDQVLSFAGKYLENYRKLYEYNILRNSILNLNLGLKGGSIQPACFQTGAPNTNAKSATVGVAFSYTLVNDGSCECTTATVSFSPSLASGNFTVAVPSKNAVFSGTAGAGDVGTYTVTVVAATFTGTTGTNTIIFTLTISAAVACIVSGQRILTPNGYKLIDDIYNGDLVTTSQNKDVVALNYKGVFQFTTNETAPYIIPKDSINPSYPPKDIFLSAEHRIQTNYNWVTPKELSKYNPEVRQLNIGKPVTYYNIETPNSATDYLVLEGTTIGSYYFPGNQNIINIHNNL